MQIIIFILLLRKFFNQLVFVFTSKIKEKNIMIFLPLSFKMSSRRVCKYFSRTILFFTLSTKIIVFLILLILLIFGDTKKSRFLKLKLVIRVTI